MTRCGDGRCTASWASPRPSSVNSSHDPLGDADCVRNARLERRRWSAIPVRKSSGRQDCRRDQQKALSPLIHSRTVSVPPFIHQMERGAFLDVVIYRIGSKRRVRVADLSAQEQLECSFGIDYCSFAYSALASFRMGTSGSASFHSVKKS